MRRRILLALAAALAAITAAAVPTLALAHTAHAATPFIGGFNTIAEIGSTVPANGDVNPYGVAVVRHSTGRLVRGDTLVSNFNAASNLQGTGTTIVELAPNGSLTLFAQLDAQHLPGACPGGVGLTTALAALPQGWVIVGSLPTSDGTAATARAGCLIVLNAWGHPVETFSGGPINGPWDMAAVSGDDSATLFVTNVLNGTVKANGAVVNRGTVLRIRLRLPEDSGIPRITDETIVGSGFPERTDPAALVIGPTGVGLGNGGTLYVADSLSNRIAAIPNALTRERTAFAGRDVSSNGALNDPLGLAIAPGGDILTVNGNDGNIV
ncbi:MAG TPA: hypothetical protein VJQ45_05425, partial [Ktedonobacterales bacterium]|nr:hypothetical protein [Ktedonobacterales bacterium]